MDFKLLLVFVPAFAAVLISPGPGSAFGMLESNGRARKRPSSKTVESCRPVARLRFALGFVASSPREFFYHRGNDDIVFELDAEGEVAALILYGDGRKAGDGQRYGRVPVDGFFSLERERRQSQ